MSAPDDAALIRAKERADTALRIAIDAARTLGYREGLAIGRKAGAVEAIREAAASWRANGLAYGDDDEETNLDILVARKLNERADRIERGEQA